MNGLIETTGESFKLAKRELTKAEKERALQHSIDEKLDTLKWKLDDLGKSIGPSKYYHNMEQLETISFNLDGIIGRVCQVGTR